MKKKRIIIRWNRLNRRHLDLSTIIIRPFFGIRWQLTMQKYIFAYRKDGVMAGVAKKLYKILILWTFLAFMSRVNYIMLYFEYLLLSQISSAKQTMKFHQGKLGYNFTSNEMCNASPPRIGFSGMTPNDQKI